MSAATGAAEAGPDVAAGPAAPPRALGGRRGRALELVLVAVGLVVAVLVWRATGARSNYDTAFHLVWGREILAGGLPGFEDYAASTPHPLWLAVCTVVVAVVPDGADADRLMALLSGLALVLLAWGGWRLAVALLAPRAGSAAADRGLRAARAAGVLTALLLASSFAFLLLAARAYLDVPFLACVVWAAVRAAERPTAWRGPALLLLLAGLLRPEAWLLAGLHWLWVGWVRHRGAPDPGAPTDRAPTRRSLVRAIARPGHLAVVLLAPALWALVDLVVTGNPLHSVTATGALAAELGRERGLANAPRVLLVELVDQARPPVAAAGVVGLVLLVVAGRLGVPRPDAPRGLLLVALLGAGVVTFLLAGVAGLSLIPRYLSVPVVGLSLLAAWAAAGWVALPAGHRLRAPWAALVAVGALLGVGGYLVVKRDSLRLLRGELAFLADSRRELRGLLADPAVLRGARCGPISLPTYRLVPEVRLLLDLPAGAVLARSAPDASARGAGVRGVAIAVAPGGKPAERFGRAAGVPRRFGPVPAGFRSAARSGPFRAAVRCPPG